MQTIMKKAAGLLLLSAIILTGFCGCGCGDNNPDKTKSDSTTTPSVVTPPDSSATPKDSLPPVDTGASTRPEVRKTKI